MLIFGKGFHPWTHKGKLITHEAAVKVLEKQQGQLPKTVLLRCRVRYFADGAIFGSAEFVCGFIGAWQRERDRKYPPKVNSMRGTDWSDLAVIQSLRQQVFGWNSSILRVKVWVYVFMRLFESISKKNN